VAGLYHRYRHAYPGPAIDVLAAFGFSIQGLDARPATPLAGRPEPKKDAVHGADGNYACPRALTSVVAGNRASHLMMISAVLWPVVHPSVARNPSS
jgi:hypothetical protein